MTKAEKFKGIYRWMYDSAQSMGLVAADSQEHAEKLVSEYIAEVARSYVFDAELLEVWAVSDDGGDASDCPEVIDFYGSE